MQIIISGQNIEVTEALRSYADKKIGKVVHYFAEAIDNGKVEMVYHKTKSPEKSCEAKVIVHVHGAILTAKEENADMYAAIDLLFEKLEKQLKKYKDKVKARKGEKVSVLMEKGLGKDNEVEEEHEPIVYVNDQSIKPMSIEEATLQLKMQKTQIFLVFADDKTSMISVIYRRKDGDFGLIESD